MSTFRWKREGEGEEESIGLWVDAEQEGDMMDYGE